MNMEQTYSTKDLYEASALYASGMPLSTLKSDGNQFWFIFLNSEECKKISDGYWRGSLDLNAKKYADAVRTLKDRVFSRK